VVRCLNCGTPLVGAYCYGCGQSAQSHRSLGAIWHDLLHNVLHFEGKLWRTLPLLIWRPGELTRRYVHGERKRFISPLSLFLSAIFLIYAVLTLTGVGDVIGKEFEKLAIKGSHQQDVEIFMYKTKTNAYKFAWVILPMSIFIMRFMFLRSKEFNWYDHYVFVTYSISLVAIILITSHILNVLSESIFSSLLGCAYIPVHMYRQLRDAYRLSWFGALCRSIALVIVSLTIVIVFFQLMTPSPS